MKAISAVPAKPPAKFSTQTASVSMLMSAPVAASAARLRCEALAAIPPISSEGISPKRVTASASREYAAQSDPEAEQFGDVGDVGLGKAEVDVKRIGHNAGDEIGQAVDRQQAQEQQGQAAVARGRNP